MTTLEQKVDAILEAVQRHREDHDRLQADLSDIRTCLQRHGRQINNAALRSARNEARVALTEQQLAALRQELESLKRSAAVWSDDSRVAIDRDAAYRGFERLGIRPLRAMDALVAQNLVIPDPRGRRTTVVTCRGKRRTVRAVMTRREGCL